MLKGVAVRLDFSLLSQCNRFNVFLLKDLYMHANRLISLETLL